MNLSDWIVIVECNASPQLTMETLQEFITGREVFSSIRFVVGFSN